ncbi:MAG: hypothetical protein L0Z55_07210 [Planctomycetes bacterium]|nr:hypothetical protein [Planctomycetota bacterium]
MKSLRVRAAILATLLLAIGAVLFIVVEREEVPPPLSTAFAFLCDPARVEARYQSWVSRHERAGGDQKVVIPLSWSKAYSRDFTRTKGVAKLDLIEGSVTIETSGQGDSNLDAWLVENTPGPK